MKRRVIVSGALVFVVALGILMLTNKPGGKQQGRRELAHGPKENEENPAAYHYLRWKYEADLIKDPTTGEALFGLRDREIAFARTIPQRNASSSVARLTVQNNYIPAGPNNNGGRT
ncbi:MAG TPA: hypothetical protein VFH08_17410, partial [Chitinophagaceae bacterium]|nr:hypothetical protein [Chitinophagaceae bacterium]